VFNAVFAILLPYFVGLHFHTARTNPLFGANELHSSVRA